ncbi:serine/threonine-protein kinase PEPKR2 [Macadamia integrifolia]|uniref:serine/threonine-protein kinase PEPKR2 n=1 Tax=Macadamia integrifolia TaxID=60698 RepID=UPI001C4EA4CF|nr:serine/threonine-protein kinase PEPKR2 [Macadamia integrifolia]
MELLRKKRKGSETQVASSDLPEILPRSRKPLPSLSIIGSHFSLEDCSRRKKKLKEHVAAEAVGSCKSRLTGIVTAPPCGSSSSDRHGRGHKRKIGCIDAATQLGRKKKIEQEYVLGSAIGRGKFGSVRLCRSKASGAELACKTLPKGEETVHREVEIMQHLSGHPGVVALKAVYEDSDSFHLVMELCSGGRLLDQMVKEGRYSEHHAANIIKELILVIKYCHEMGVVHRDIKPENILLTAAGKMKLADFGLAVRFSNGQKLSGIAGSPAYVAPEVLLGDYTDKVDIWGAGVLLHALLVGTLPFHGDSQEAIFEAIKKVTLDFHGGVWEAISEPARDLMGRMLTRDVSARITADEVLRHPWILFYTERTLKTLTSKSKVRHNEGALSHQLNVVRRVESERFRVSSDTVDVDSCLVVSLDGMDGKTEEQDDCSFIDALAVAISRVRISEPKRSRLCGPALPIKQECSSNMKANTLCTAF